MINLEMMKKMIQWPTADGVLHFQMWLCVKFGVWGIHDPKSFDF